METLLRRTLGLYFAITSLGYVPAALVYLGVENALGPWWVLPLVPLSQAAVFFTAGVILLRSRSEDVVPLGPGVVFPPVDVLLQLTGVYFVVVGLESVVEPAVSMLFVTEAWSARVGQCAAAIVWLASGWVLVRHPRKVVEALTRHTVA